MQNLDMPIEFAYNDYTNTYRNTHNANMLLELLIFSKSQISHYIGQMNLD
jgi:hypothetical protein